MYSTCCFSGGVFFFFFFFFFFFLRGDHGSHGGATGSLCFGLRVILPSVFKSYGGSLAYTHIVHGVLVAGQLCDLRPGFIPKWKQVFISRIMQITSL